MQQIEKAQSEHFETKTEQSAARLQKYKEDLEELRKPMIDGLIIRSRTMWHEEGERFSKYFLGLEKKCVKKISGSTENWWADLNTN